MRRNGLSERGQVACFFALALFAWVIWGPQALHRLGRLGWTVSARSPLNFLAVWSPGLAAMLLARLAAGRGGAAALFRGLGVWRVPVGWYAFAVLFEPVRWLLALGIDRLAGRSYELGGAPLLQALGPSAAALAPVALVLTLPNALGEELGWRAFALPRLERAGGPLVASIVLGLFWGAWHLPMWIAVRSAEPRPLPLLLLVLNLVPVALLFTFLFDRTGGSLLLVCLFHASMAIKGYLLPSLPSATGTALLWLAAAVVVRFGGFLGRPATARLGDVGASA